MIEPTFPDKQMLQSRIYPSEKMAVIETSFLVLGECACDQFHFLIPLKQAHAIRTEGRLHSLKEMSVFPCNPLQPHRVVETGLMDFHALVLYMENSFLQSTAWELFGRSGLEFKSRCFALSPAMRELLDRYMRECRACQPGCELMLESISLQVAVTLLRESCHNLSDSALKAAIYTDEKAIKTAIDYISDNYQNRLSLFEIARETHYSPYHFLRLFKQHIGKTPFGFLLNLKIEKAKDMLKYTDCAVSQICDLCGFSSPSYFSQAFREKTGMTPTQYKSECMR